MAESQRINQREAIAKIRQLLIDEGLDPQIVSYAEVTAGVGQMLRGFGIEAFLDSTDTADRTWPSNREEADSPW